MTVAPRYAPYADVKATGLAAPLLLPPECSQQAAEALEQDDWWSSHAVFHRRGTRPSPRNSVPCWPAVVPHPFLLNSSRFCRCLPKDACLRRCVAAGVDRVFVEHPIFERAARNIYGANYTYVDSDAGVPDLDLRWDRVTDGDWVDADLYPRTMKLMAGWPLRWSILSQAALVAPVVLWPPPLRQHGASAARGSEQGLDTAAQFEPPPDHWAEVSAAAHTAAEQAQAERAVQQERLAREADRRASYQQAAEAAMSDVTSGAVAAQLQQDNGTMPATYAQSETAPGGDAQSSVSTMQPSSTEVHPVSAVQQALDSGVASESAAAAAKHSQAAASGGWRPGAGTLQPAAASDGPFETGVIFVGTTAPSQCTNAACKSAAETRLGILHMIKCSTLLRFRLLRNMYCDVVMQVTTGRVHRWCCGCSMRCVPRRIVPPQKHCQPTQLPSVSALRSHPLLCHGRQRSEDQQTAVATAQRSTGAEPKPTSRIRPLRTRLPRTPNSQQRPQQQPRALTLLPSTALAVAASHNSCCRRSRSGGRASGSASARCCATLASPSASTTLPIRASSPR